MLFAWNPLLWAREGHSLWRCLFAGFVLIVVILSLAPPSALPPQAFSLWDKAQHALAFVVLAVFGLQAYPGRWPWVVGGLLVLGGAIELAQALVGWRTGDVADWCADAIGMWVGGVLFKGLRQRTQTSQTTS